MRTTATDTTPSPLGAFTITGDYTCPSASSEVYLVATGGNPGLSFGTTTLQLRSSPALGPCGNLGTSTYVFVDELTTIGSIATLYPYMTSYAALGSGSSDLSTFQSAFAAVNEYTNTTDGTAPGPALPAGYYASTTEIDTLATSCGLHQLLRRRGRRRHSLRQPVSVDQAQRRRRTY